MRAHAVLALALLSVSAGLSMSVSISACDPVHSDAIDALGPETPGVRRGPLHRPGQPCLLCHDGSVGSPEGFSVAGTIFLLPSTMAGVEGAEVRLTDATGSSYDATTNAAGNFYVLPSQWTPHYPVVVAVQSPNGQAVVMHTFIDRDGSCAGCHVDPAGPSSPGHVSLRLEDGGTPP